jgi:hypothetical protein
MLRTSLTFLNVLLMVGLMATVGVHADEPPMEKLVLADGEVQGAWQTAEATMQPDATHGRDGPALRFHVDVNHETGQPDYPIGWPRTYLSLPEEVRDWRKWDFVEFWLYADSSRERLPPAPLGFIVRSPDRSNSYHRPVDQAQQGQWVHVRIPTSDMPDPSRCTAVQFFVAESDYHHGDVLDFWIDDLALLRYAQPTILGMQPLGQVQYTDTGVVRVEVEMTGLEQEQTARLLLRLVRDDETSWQGSATVGPGMQTVPLEIGGNLDGGSYQLQARIEGGQSTISQPIRFIRSPWQ